MHPWVEPERDGTAAAPAAKPTSRGAFQPGALDRIGFAPAKPREQQLEHAVEEQDDDDAGDQIEDDHQPLRVHPRAVRLLAGLSLPSPCSLLLRSKNWQARRDSNPQHAVLETAALPLELLA